MPTKETKELLHFVGSIEEGLKDIRQGRVVSQEEVETALKGWLSE